MTCVRAKLVVQRLLLVLLSLALGLVLVEAALQVSHRPAVAPFEYDPLLGWNVKLYFEGREHSAEGDVLVRSNGQRMRESRDLPTQTDAYRIAVAGDSMVWGHGVDEEQRFTELLEAKLGPGFEVLNFGVAGFGSGQILLKVQQDVVPLHPDMLIVAFFLNDLIELRQDSSQGLPKPRFVAHGDGVKLTGVPVRRVEGWDHLPWELQLPKRIRSVLDQARRSDRLGDGSFFAAHVEPFERHRRKWLAESLRLNDLIYAEMRELAKQHGMEFVVVQVPFKEYFMPDDVIAAELGMRREELRFDRPSERLRALARKRGFLYVDPYPLFEQLGGTDNFFAEGPHLSPRGHTTTARLLHEALVSSGLLPVSEGGGR